MAEEKETVNDYIKYCRIALWMLLGFGLMHEGINFYRVQLEAARTEIEITLRIYDALKHSKQADPTKIERL